MAGESSVNSSKTATAPRRKFAAEPVETSARSSKEDRDRKEKGADKPADKTRRKFLPQPVEETTRSSKDAFDDGDAKNVTGNGHPEKKPRRFAAQPVETVKRVRRRNTGNALQPGDKTDDSPEDKLKLPRANQANTAGTAPPVNSPYNEGLESRFSYASLARKPSRQSSIRRPSLEPISSVPESEESNLSKPSTASTTESTHADAQRTLRPAGPRQKNLQKESYEEVFSGYLLNMAANQAQQQLREQAADAYPNERIHQPVDHFAADRESDSDTETGVGRMSEDVEEISRTKDRKASAGWDASEVNKHRAALEDQKKVETPSTAPRKDPFGGANFNMAGIGADASAPRDRDREEQSMRKVARPPMLGGSLVFPKCPSPSMTLIDPLQRHGTRKNTQLASHHQSGLWSPGGFSPEKRESPQSSVSLWHGNCTAEQAERFNLPNNPNLQMGIMTPVTAPDEDPFIRWHEDTMLQGQIKKQHQLNSKPGSRVNSVLGIDQLLAMEQRILGEYTDEFVTQIYNYLSLGYPAIAREFDEELSKISKMPVETIRSDDERQNTKGFVNAPEGTGSEEDDVKDQCGRWQALRLYIHEWARQQPHMMIEGANEAQWGATARRGSWFS